VPKAARVTDSTIGSVGHHNGHGCPNCCSGHSGVSGRQTTGSSKVFFQGQKAARVGDSGTTSCPCCGGPYRNTKGSKKVFIQGRAAARVGDEVDYHGQGKGTLISGASKVFINV
jgi:uncharacterized Zn-binding protein involved in type VI secretion